MDLEELLTTPRQRCFPWSSRYLAVQDEISDIAKMALCQKTVNQAIIRIVTGDPFKVHISGPAGTGKSFLAEKLRVIYNATHADSMHQVDCLTVFSPMNPVAIIQLIDNTRGPIVLENCTDLCWRAIAPFIKRYQCNVVLVGANVTDKDVPGFLNICTAELSTDRALAFVQAKLDTRGHTGVMVPTRHIRKSISKIKPLNFSKCIEFVQLMCDHFAMRTFGKVSVGYLPLCAQDVKFATASTARCKRANHMYT